MNMVKFLLKFEYFYIVLEKSKHYAKIRRSKVTGYAALTSKYILDEQ